MSGFADLPDDWRVWNDEDGGSAVVVFRPDVFDSQQHPAACLPTIYVTRRPPTQRKHRAGQSYDAWHVSLRLEPEVRVKDADARFETREDAVAGAVDLAERFSAGEVDYRDAYQLPRDDYLDELDELTG